LYSGNNFKTNWEAFQRRRGKTKREKEERKERGKRKKKREKGRIEGKEGERKEKRRRDEKRGMMGKKRESGSKTRGFCRLFADSKGIYSGTTSDNII